MKAPKYVIAPEGCADYLTPGMGYEIRDFRVDNTYGGSFHITDDHGGNRFCLLKECATLNDGNWIIPDDESDGESVIKPVVECVSAGDIDVSINEDDRSFIILSDGESFIETPRANIPALIEALKMVGGE